MQQQGHDAQHPDSEAEHIRIGDLLTDAGIVTRGDVLESIQISKRMNLPIGRVLVMSGVLTELLLTAALQVQDLLRDNKLTLDEAYQALNYVHANQSDLDTAMEALDCKPSTDHSKSKLGLLLVDSDIVTPQQVEEALAASFGSGIPLGSMLVLQGMLSAQLLPGILDAQERLRNGKINHVDAVAEIRTQFDYWAHATDSKSEMLMTLDDQNTPAVSFPAVPSSKTASANAAGSSKKKSGKKDGAATGQHPTITGEHKALKAVPSSAQGGQGKNSTTGSHKAITTGELRAFNAEENEPFTTGQYAALIGGGGVAGSGKLSRRQKRLQEKQQGSKKAVVSPEISTWAEPDQSFTLENNEDLSMMSLLEMGGLTDSQALQDRLKHAFKDAETTIRVAQLLGLVSKKHVEAAVLCYSLVSQWKLTIPEAVGVLAEMRVTDRPIDEILAKHHLGDGEDED